MRLCFRCAVRAFVRAVRILKIKAKNGKSRRRNSARQNNAVERASAKKTTDEEEHGEMNLIRGDGTASESNGRVNHRERNEENGRQVRVEGGVPSVS